MSLNFEKLSTDNYDLNNPTELKEKPFDVYSYKRSSVYSELEQKHCFYNQFTNNNTDNEEFYKDFLFKVKEEHDKTFKSEERNQNKNNVVIHSLNGFSNIAKREIKSNSKYKLKTVQSFSKHPCHSPPSSFFNLKAKIKGKEVSKKESFFKRKNDKLFNVYKTMKKIERSPIKLNKKLLFSTQNVQKDNSLNMTPPKILVIERIKSIEEIGKYIQKEPKGKSSFNTNPLINKKDISNNGNQPCKVVDKGQNDYCIPNKCNFILNNTSKNSINKNDQILKESESNVDIVNNNSNNNNNDKRLNIFSYSTGKQVKKTRGWFSCCFPG